MLYYFDDKFKSGDFDSDCILIDKKSRKSILIYDVSYKILISPKFCALDWIKWMDLLEFFIKLAS